MKPVLQGALLLFAALLCGAGVGACARSDEGTATPSADELRIISFSPALSRAIVDVGLGSHVFGRTPYCASVDQDVPVVGSLLDVDFELLVRLRPTHVLVQPPMAHAGPRLAELAEEHGWTLGEWRLSSTADVRRVLRDLPGLFSGATRDAVDARCQTLLARLDEVLRPGPAVDAPLEVMILADLDPVLAFGRTTYLDELLTALGGVNIVTDSGWVEMSMEDLVRRDPPAIVITRSSRAGANGPDPGVAEIAALDIRAARDGRIAVLAHPDVLLPSTSVIGVAEAFEEVLDTLVAQAP